MPTFPISSDLAEVLGVLLGDGCAFSYPRASLYGVSFTGNRTEFNYYRDFVKPVLEGSFDVHGRLYLREDNTVRYVVNSKRLISTLIELGIPIGKRRDAVIPEAVRSQQLVIPFIRGFYHAEGSIYRRYSKKYGRHSKVYDNLFVIQIRTKLRSLMTQLTFELSKLGVVTNRLIEKDGVYTLRITSQSEIRRFMAIVHPRYKTLARFASL